MKEKPKKYELKQEIFNYLKKIPKEKTMTYKELAEKFNTSPRAVGMILKSNKDKSVPCYKVIKSNGKLGGYNKLHGNSKKELIKEERKD